MGRLIQCCGCLAKRPYHFHLGNMRVYSIEEVCYFIAKNIYLLQKDIFGKGFVDWLREELAMEETADKMERLLEGENTLKDMVVTLCCSCDYFDEPQINELIHIMDETEHLPERERLKIKADTELQSGYYEGAIEGYQSILRSEDMMQASPAEYGPLYHNIGVALGLLGEYDRAADHFLRAYETNKKEQSLKSYIIALRLAGQEDAWKEVAEQLGLSHEKVASLKAEYLECRKKCSISVRVRQVKKLRYPASIGKLPEYYEPIRESIRDWKEEYRREIRIK